MALILLGMLVLAAQVFADCPEKSALGDFDTSAFLGTWHTVKTNAPSSLLGRSNAKCLHNVLTQEGDKLNSLTMFYNKTSSEYQSMSGVLTKEDAASNDAKFTLSRAGQTSAGNGKYYILDTDYTNYAVAWLCLTRDSKNYELTAVLSRAKTLSAASEIEVNKVLPTGDYSLTDQTACPDHEHHSH
ncbi:unnamed protein product [Timema podura]|uniref:Lipocalin/cytosolic fatty-acid binding domain-containing protein n=1 Tax=Timema podura TaxID=61482 RepID=A0ABN7NRM0_TIMPD|nr:unnamed protein product [Timema podura]